jgi:hypothetical protein
MPGQHIRQRKVIAGRDRLHTRRARFQSTRDLRRPALRVYFTDRRVGSILPMPAPLFTSMIWSPSQRGALEFQVRRSALHLLFQLAQQLGNIEVPAGFLNN